MISPRTTWTRCFTWALPWTFLVFLPTKAWGPPDGVIACGQTISHADGWEVGADDDCPMNSYDF
jgi:hypothetical protein